jgi:hypothetical protein
VGVDVIGQGPLKGSALIWNNRGDPGSAFWLSGRTRWSEFQSESGVVPHSTIVANDLYRRWRLRLDCFGLASIDVEGGSEPE